MQVWSKENADVLVIELTVREASELRDHLGRLPMFVSDYPDGYHLFHSVNQVIRKMIPPAKKKHWWSR